MTKYIAKTITYSIVTTPWLWKLCEWCVIWTWLFHTENTFKSTVFTRWPFHIVTTHRLGKLCEWCVIWRWLVHTENNQRSPSVHTVTSSRCDHWCVIWTYLVHTENNLRSHCVHTVTSSRCDHSQTRPYPYYENSMNNMWFSHGSTVIDSSIHTCTCTLNFDKNRGKQVPVRMYI